MALEKPIFRKIGETTISNTKPYNIRKETKIVIAELPLQEVRPKAILEILPAVQGSQWKYCEGTQSVMVGALGGRQLRDNGLKPCRFTLAQLKQFTFDLCQCKWPVVLDDPLEHQEWLDTRPYTSTKSKRSLKGYLKWVVYFCVPRARILMVKKEFVNKEDSAYDRLISMRTPEAAATFGPIAMAMTRVIKEWMNGVNSPFIWTSGLSCEKIAAVLGVLVDDFGCTVGFDENDFTLFDSSQNPEIQHAIEGIIYPFMLQHHMSDPRVLEFLADFKSSTKTWHYYGNTRDGGEVTGKCVGTRSTGDANTTLGNTLISIVMISFAICMTNGWTAEKFMNLPYKDRIHIFAAGDDTLVVRPKKYKCMDIQWIQKCGIICDFHTSDKLHEVEFCSLWFAWGEDNNRQRVLLPMKKLGKLFTRLSMTVEAANRTPAYYHELAIQKCDAFLNLTHMFPAFTTYIRRQRMRHLIRCPKAVIARRDKRGDLDKLMKTGDLPFFQFDDMIYSATHETMDALCQRYNISMGEWVAMEQYLLAVTIDPILHHPTLDKIRDRDLILNESSVYASAT